MTESPVTTEHEPPDGSEASSGSPRQDPAASPTWSSTVQRLVDEQAEESLTAAELVLRILAARPGYLRSAQPSGFDPADERVAGTGPRRTVLEHLEEARKRWDEEVSPLLTGRRVVLGMAMDPGVGWLLLRTGVVVSLLDGWQPRSRSTQEPELLVWDMLSDYGRALADEQPLLATALGAPSEWRSPTGIPLPATVTSVAWSASGERLAVLAGDTVYEIRPGAQPRQLDVAPPGAVSLGWTGQGVVALCRTDGGAVVRRVADRGREVALPSATDATLSGDGLHVWISRSELVCWTIGQETPRLLGATGRPLAVDWDARHGLVQAGAEIRLLQSSPQGQDDRSRGALIAAASEPGPASSSVAVETSRTPPCAVVGLVGAVGAARVADGGGVEIVRPGESSDPDRSVAPTTVARVATGAGTVSAMAADRSGTSLAVAVGDVVGVWTLRPDRRQPEVPQYDPDRPRTGGGDLIDVDRDAVALAQLIASAALEPPLAIGLFGAWGSGKSFVLDRIESELERLMESKPKGYLESVQVVRFNAWHYSEDELWASLVHQVLTKMLSAHGLPVDLESEAPEAADASAAVDVENLEINLQEERRRVQAARRYWAAIIVSLVGAGLIATVLVLEGLLDAWVALAASLTSAVAVTTALVKRFQDISLQGRSLFKAAGDLTGTQVKRAEQLLEQKREEEGSVRGVLRELPGTSRYREQLGDITDTRDMFEKIDKAVSASRPKPEPKPAQPDASAAVPEGPDPPSPTREEPFQRVVIMIDDLDRCPAEKVVHVLEAVHLLFDFRMFVVVLAVDTRWLEQSLRIRYRKLLGKTATATPADYLEKIIQIPLHLMPLRRDRVVQMLQGLTGTATGSADTGAAGAAGATPTTRTGPAVEVAAERDLLPRRSLTATVARPRPAGVPAHPLRTTAAEIDAMAAVAPLIGTTPRTVKRFVNTYRLLKAQEPDATSFASRRDGLGDHEVVALLLALVTGHPDLAARLIDALSRAPDADTLDETVRTLAPTGTAVASKATLLKWLQDRPRHANGKVARYSYWAVEVGRYSFVPPAAFRPGADEPGRTARPDDRPRRTAPRQRARPGPASRRQHGRRGSLPM